MESVLKIYKGEVQPDWCPGCGDFAVLNAIQRALYELNLDPKDVLIVSGIGCSSNLPGFISTYGFHGIHGRAIPVATGAKLANPELTVIVTVGDGDCYGIGMGHFIHAMRRNPDITVIVMNNQVYGLTTGQASPTSMKKHVTKSTPFGVIDDPINPIALAIAGGATYVSRGFSGDPIHLAQLIKNGILHKGFALVDVFSPCVTFNKLNTYEWFRKRIYKLESIGHDPTNFELAIKRAYEFGDKIPIGLFYKAEKPSYEEYFEDIYKGKPLVYHDFPNKEQIKEIMKEFY
ncbi:MAG: thiamine pyrophosphate-dependent enzyme [Thermoproteota archaeon]|jgi:2-oxoacid:acceptor oxidoreductase, beta subunit, pyruvate/2-ketoisovalerate family